MKTSLDCKIDKILHFCVPIHQHMLRLDHTENNHEYSIGSFFPHIVGGI